ncbi:MAG: 4Fe-4S ferredoxin [Actinobacteria bacterium]|nr:4Fe-4S ferredoxin [Actinomycetota bacterium]
MLVTAKHLFKRTAVIQYPDEKQDLPSRTRGVIALKEENCTVCMLCARECPDWCIYIDSHKEELPPKREGGRARKRNVLDRFAIDYALCMYCGICVEVCPYDALFWSREFEYAEFDIRHLTHEKEKLSDWMATVLPPPPLERGADIPGEPSQLKETLAEPAPAPEPTPAPQAEAPAPKVEEPKAEAPAAQTEVPEAEAKAEPKPAEPEPTPEPEAPAAKAEPIEKRPAPELGVPQVQVPVEAAHPVALEKTEDPEAVYEQVLKEQLDKGSSPQVAEARAKVARVKAERGIKRGPTPVDVDKPVPSAPTKAEQAKEDNDG